MNETGVGEGGASSDEVLVRQVQAGDHQAFEILVLKYQERVFRLIRRLLGDREPVEDLAQEVFIRVYRSLGTFRGKSAFYTWMYKIALNTCRNYYRSLSRRPEGSLGTEEVQFENLKGEDGGPEKEAFRAEFWSTVQSSLEQLQPEQREAVVLCDLEGLSYEEMSEVIGIPVGTVRSRVFRGRRALQNLLEPYLHGTIEGGSQGGSA